MGRLGALIPIIIALVIAAVASFLLYNWMQQQSAKGDSTPDTDQETVSVVVAKVGIPAGTELKADMLKTVKYLKTSLPPGNFTSVEELAERVLISTVEENEPIIENRLAPIDVKRGGIAVLVSPGKRALAISGNKVIGMSGLIKPQDHVDVMVTITDPAALDPKRKEITKLVLANIKVLATGTQLEKTADGKNQAVDVYTLEVTPAQGERLALASSKGRLHFALRNSNDGESVSTPGANIPDTLAVLDIPQVDIADQTEQLNAALADAEQARIEAENMAAELAALKTDADKRATEAKVMMDQFEKAKREAESLAAELAAVNAVRDASVGEGIDLAEARRKAEEMVKLAMERAQKESQALAKANAEERAKEAKAMLDQFEKAKREAEAAKREADAARKELETKIASAQMAANKPQLPPTPPRKRSMEIIRGTKSTVIEYRQ